MALSRAEVAAERQKLREYWRRLAEEAFETGEQALAQGQLNEAAWWLARARRLSPKQATVRLLLAILRLRRGDPDVEVEFAALAGEYRGVEILSGLAMARALRGDWKAVAEAAQRLLSCYRLADIPVSADLLAEAVRASGRSGWCFLTSAGHLRWFTAEGQEGAPDALTLRLDGEACRHVPPGRRLMLGNRLDVLADGRALLGAPLDLAAMHRVHGWVGWDRAGGLRGWAWYPGCPEADPVLQAVPADPSAAPWTVMARDAAEDAGLDTPFARPRAFRIPASRLQGTGLVAIRDARGRDLLGSPLNPGLGRLLEPTEDHATPGALKAGTARAATALRTLARRLPADGPLAVLPADRLPDPKPLSPLRCAEMADVSAASGPLTPSRPVSVIIPVHGGGETTLACLASVLATVPAQTDIIVIDDAGPEPELLARLQAIAEKGDIRLLRQARNRGFPAAVNLGMRAAAGRDVVLLNSDTLVPPGWLEKLRNAAYAAPDIGTAAPLSNDASILSYPHEDGSGPLPDLKGVRALARLAHRANADRVVDIPVAVGFCMFIRRDCLDAAGAFRDDVFAQGYGEENDFCLRARALGWRHVAAAGAFVAHIGGGSFGDGKPLLADRNEAILAALHPGYHAMVAAWRARNPLGPSRHAMDALRLRAEVAGRPGVLLITHDRGGGVQRQIESRIAHWREAGYHTAVLRPVMIEATASYAGHCVLDTGFSDSFPNLRFQMPDDKAALLRLLRSLRIDRVELHHLLGHDHSVSALAAGLRVPQDIHVHDYAAVCPRIALMNPARHYCGEPDIKECESCIAQGGSNLEEEIGVADLRRRSARDFAAAGHVVVPSLDVARRVTRYFPAVRPVVSGWETLNGPRAPVPVSRPMAGAWADLAGRVRIVCVVGAIGAEKGFDRLLDAARDAAARALPLRFVLTGHSVDDPALLETGYVKITGRYEETEAAALIAAQGAALAWIPSIWPETWCFALSEAWRAGLPVAAFDLGTPAERIRQASHQNVSAGFLLPFGLSTQAINETFLFWRADRTGFAQSANPLNMVSL